MMRSKSPLAVGPPIQMIEITQLSSGATQATELASADLSILHDKVAEWKSIEAETLRQVVGIDAGGSETDDSKGEVGGSGTDGE